MTDTCPGCHAEREITPSGVCETCRREIDGGRMVLECRQRPQNAFSGDLTVSEAAASCQQSTLF